VCSPYNLAVSLLEEIGLGLAPILGKKHPPSLDDSISPAHAWRCLLQLPAFSVPTQNGSVRGTLYSFFDESEEKWRETANRRVLSSDQPFLGFIKSPRPGHLIRAPGRMGELLEGTSYREIEMRLHSMYQQRLRAGELATRVSAIAGVLDVRPPTGRKRSDYLARLDQYSPRALEVLQDRATDSGLI
jgi:hypothetical protein